jgi:hypothetical protein
MNSKTVKEHASPPWYRVGMVWLMIGLPATVVVASLCTTFIAYQNAPQVTTVSQPK